MTPSSSSAIWGNGHWNTARTTLPMARLLLATTRLAYSAHSTPIPRSAWQVSCAHTGAAGARTNGMVLQGEHSSLQHGVLEPHNPRPVRDHLTQ
jgi:hypothetical protein